MSALPPHEGAAFERGPRVYCTHFDSHYAARGLAMVRSLRRHDPSARIVVVGLDPLTQRIVHDQLGAEVMLVTPGDLLAAEPRLATLHGRSTWERYATQKPVVPLLALQRLQDACCVVTIDADTLFFSNPGPMFAEIGDASIGLSPHRYHGGAKHLTRYGTFNAGCVYWRNDAVGRQCLTDWKEDCLAWCHERVDIRGRFMNQGYLGRWPKRYPGVHVIRHPGVNLAPWNIDGHTVEARGDSVMVDGAVLIFYHFSGVVEDAAGRWYTWYRNMRRNLDVAMRALYAPYIAEIEATRRAIAREYPIEDAVPIRPYAVDADYIPLPGSRGG